MLVDQLGHAIPAQQDTKIVIPSDHALKFDTVHKKDREGRLGLSDSIEKCVLQILELIRHCFYPREPFVVGRFDLVSQSNGAPFVLHLCGHRKC